MTEIFTEVTESKMVFQFQRKNLCKFQLRDPELLSCPLVWNILKLFQLHQLY
jgi:hypothetical protein